VAINVRTGRVPATPKTKQILGPDENCRGFSQFALSHELANHLPVYPSIHNHPSQPYAAQHVTLALSLPAKRACSARTTVVHLQSIGYSVHAGVAVFYYKAHACLQQGAWRVNLRLLGGIGCQALLVGRCTQGPLCSRKRSF